MRRHIEAVVSSHQLVPFHLLLTAPGQRSKVISDRLFFQSNEAAAFTFGVGERHLLPPPQAQVGPLQLLGDQGVELQGGSEPGADLVLVLDLQHGPGAAQVLHHRLGLLQQLVAVYRPLWRRDGRQNRGSEVGADGW